VVEDDRKGEDEWFRRNEEQLLEQARVAREKREAERAAAEKEEDRRRLREQHYMKCPKDGHDLVEELLEGIRLDRCTFCEGIFFDPGELDQLLAKRDEERKGFFRRLVKI
jgi:hypothetical protein